MKLPLHLFAWPSRHNVQLALPLMILLSLGLHVAGVAVFQVAYPRSHASPERSAEVYFLKPGSAEAAKIAPLLAASDPALFSPGVITGRDAWKLPETAYAANFDTDQPILDPLPAETPGSFLPDTASTGPVTSNVAALGETKKRAPGLPTVLRLEGGLKGRAITPPANLPFASTRTKEMPPTTFLLAVSPDGLPLHIFPLHVFSRQTSGNEDLDQTALRYLAASRFSPDPATTEPAWGTAVFLWGDDVRRITKP